MTIKIHAERQMFNDTIALRLLELFPSGEKFVAQPFTMIKCEQGQRIEPFVELEVTAAQALMDELWHVGLRPSEGSGSAGSLAATERHLADMKQIAFHALKVKP